MSRKVGKVLCMKEANVTVEEALENFLFFKKANGLCNTTLNDYEKHVNRFFDRYPDAWQSPTFKKSVMQYMSDEIMPATYNLRLIYLKAFFQWCIKECYLYKNPLEDFKKRKADPRIVDVPEDTLQSLLKLPNQSTFAGLRDYALIMFTLDTGIRPKEALSLKVDDFDLKHCLANVPAVVAKTRTSRSVPILPPTAEAINKLIRSRHPKWENDVPVFASSEGTPLDDSTWRHRCMNYSEKLGSKISGNATQNGYQKGYQ